MSADAGQTQKGQDDAAAELRRALARAAVESHWTARRLRRGISKGSCLFLTFLALVSGLGGIFYWGWSETPQPRLYQPLAYRQAGRETRLGKGWTLTLTGSWREAGFLAFIADNGATLSVTHGTLRLLHMTPKVWSGAEATQVYTSTAYAAGLRRRYAGLGETLRSHYIKLGPYEGVEAWLAMADGRIARAFALVLNEQSVLELRFQLPADMASPSWPEAEKIFCSLRHNPSTAGQ